MLLVNTTFRLVKDRELQLHDGKRLIRSDRYDTIKNEQGKTDEEMTQSGIFRIHPDFCIVALAEPPALGSAKTWITPEVLSLFLFHEMRTLRKDEEMHIITSIVSLPTQVSDRNLLFMIISSMDQFLSRSIN